MAIDWIDIRPALRSWFMTATGLDDAHVIWKNQTYPRDQGTFAVINPRFSVTPIGIYDEERLDASTPGQVDRIAQRRLTVACDTYGANAIELMETAQEALNTYATRAILDTAGLAVSDRGVVHDLTALLNTTYEERAHLDVIFCVAAVTTEQVGTMAQSSITATLTGGVYPNTIAATTP